MEEIDSPIMEQLKDWIDLSEIPFTERGSRLMVFREDHRFSVRLAERWIKRDHMLSAYRGRPPLILDWQFTDQNRTPLAIESSTYPHKISFSTTCGIYQIAFLDAETLLIKLPPGRHGLTFLAQVDQAETDRRGGVLKLVGEIRRSIAYTTNMRLLENRVEVETNGYFRVTLVFDESPLESHQHALLLNITPRLGFTRYIPDVHTAFLQAAKRWQDWFAAAPQVEADLEKQYYVAWWIMRAGLINTRYYITREAMTPSKLYYVGVWQWDAYFHALAYRYVDVRLAQDQLRILLDHQLPNGMIPDAIHDEGIVTHLDFPVDADVTKPPLIAWAAWKLYEYQPDAEFINEIYEPIARWNDWWFSQNDLDGNGLCEYQHPFSSGLDDSPMWDDGMPVQAPDLNIYLYLQQDALAHMAEVIGEQAEARRWAERANDLLEKLIASSWDKTAGYFWPYREGQPVQVRTPFSLFPLLSGRLPEKIASRLVSHLTDPQEFWTRFPCPTVALNDPKYDPQQMWRGPTWVNVNYLLIEGLRTSGYADLARELRHRTLDMMSQHLDFYEYYDPETGQNPPKAAPIFGWSAAIFINLAIQASREGKGV